MIALNPSAKFELTLDVDDAAIASAKSEKRTPPVASKFQCRHWTLDQQRIVRNAFNEDGVARGPFEVLRQSLRGWSDVSDEAGTAVPFVADPANGNPTDETLEVIPTWAKVDLVRKLMRINGITPPEIVGKSEPS